MAFKLTISKGYEQGKEIVVGKDEATIGRTEDNDVVLTEIGVSRRHLRLFTRSGKLCAEDLGSHRTLLNDAPLTEPRELSDGDLLGVGPVVLKVEVLPGREAPPPIDRVETRVAAPDPGEAPDIHRLPTAPAGRDREVVPIDRGPTAPVPAAAALEADREGAGAVAVAVAIDREPTDPQRIADPPVLPPLPPGLISRLKGSEAQDASRAETPALAVAAPPDSRDTPAFELPASPGSARALGEASVPRSPPRGSPAQEAVPLGSERLPASSGKGANARSAPARSSGQKDAPGRHLGDGGAPRSSGVKESLRAEGASGQKDALRGPSDGGRPSGVKDALRGKEPSWASGAKEAVRPEGARASGARDAPRGAADAARPSGLKDAPRPSGAKDALRASGQKAQAPVASLAARARNEAAGIFDDAIRPSAWPSEDDRPTMAQAGRPNDLTPTRPLRIRRPVIAAALLVAVLALISSVTWFVSVRSGGPLGPSELEAEPLEASFGQGPGVTHPIDGEKTFQLDLVPEPRVVAVLHFEGAFLSEGELQVTLNGAPLPHRAGAAGEGVSEVEVVLVREALRQDGENVLTVRRAPNFAGDPNWRVARPWVERVAVPDEPDAALVDGALRFAARGREYLDRSASAPDSLFQAWRAYRSAWLTVEPVRPRHPLFLEATMKYEAIGQNLDQRCLALISSAERSLQGRDAKGARDSLDQVARYFPSGEHRCHNLALELLAQHGL